MNSFMGEYEQGLIIYLEFLIHLGKENIASFLLNIIESGRWIKNNILDHTYVVYVTKKRCHEQIHAANI